MRPFPVFHRSQYPWCHAEDPETLVFRLQTPRGKATSVDLVTGDPFDWAPGPGALPESFRWNHVLVPLKLTVSDGAWDWWESRWSPPYRRARYAFLIRSGGRSWQLGDQGLNQVPGPCQEPDFQNMFLMPYLHESEIPAPPAWVAGTVWYQIFPDRFHRGDKSGPPPRPWGAGPVTNHEFYGGDLPGIIDKLDYLRDLGVTGLYLTPIFESPSVHKYDTTDYETVDPTFGTREDLKKLVSEAHLRGMRVILDGVFNHVGKLFGPWRDVLDRGTESPYAGWFHLGRLPLFSEGTDTGDRRQANFETFSFTTKMPKLATVHPEAREYILGVAEKWTKDLGIDGWRLDVANEVDHGFWREFRTRIKAVNPEAYLVGEIWGDALPWLSGDQFDGVMHYPGGQAIVGFANETGLWPDGPGLAGRLGTLEMAYPGPALKGLMNLVDSHDTVRLMDQVGGRRDLARIVWVLTAFLPGSPCFYYGSEVGMAGGADPDNRRCMVWDPEGQDPELTTFFRDLLGVRSAMEPYLAAGQRISLSSSRHPGTFGWRFAGPGPAAVVLVHRGPRPPRRGLTRDLGLPPDSLWKDFRTGKTTSLVRTLATDGWVVALEPS